MAEIDEGLAWRLLLEVRREGREGGGRISLPDVPDSWLDLDPGGAWSASADCTEDARTLLDIYLPLVARPDTVVGQLGQSLDGRIATEAGGSHYVTGPEDLERLHRVRALVDAVVVGAHTVALDDPRLTVRRVEGPSPARVVLDPAGRLEPSRSLFTDGAARTLVVRAVNGSNGRPAPGVELVTVPVDHDGHLDLPKLLEALRSLGLRRILVEGGGITVSRFLAAGLLDRLHLTVAALLIGSGRPSITLDPVAGLQDALRPSCRHFPLGADLLFDLDLRAPS